MGVRPDRKVSDRNSEGRESETVTAHRSHLSPGGAPWGRDGSQCESQGRSPQIIADAVSPKNGELETEIRYLKDRVAFLEADIAERKEREAWLRGQVALPAPDQKQGALSRFLHWFTVR